MEPIGLAARYPSPLRYPGGKGKVANYIKLLIIQNDMLGIDYVEPYAGGGSVALALLFEEFVGKIQINDLNKGVYAFWKLATEDHEWLCSKIFSVPLDIDEWQRQKAIYSDESATLQELGFATFYLNRTNRSGIIARGGVIGGNDQTGRWNIDARFNRASLAARISKIARFASRISITNVDALGLLRREYARRAGQRLLYLDPPYYVKGGRLYDNAYEHADHLAVSKAVVRLPGPWVVSYDAAPEILSMYREQKAISYILGYSASKNERGTEVMFFSPDLAIPDVASPSGVTGDKIRNAKLAMATLF